MSWVLGCGRCASVLPHGQILCRFPVRTLAPHRAHTRGFDTTYTAPCRPPPPRRLKDIAGKPSGLIGWYPTKAVTFVENHDTGSTQGHW